MLLIRRNRMFQLSLTLIAILACLVLLNYFLIDNSYKLSFENVSVGGSASFMAANHSSVGNDYVQQVAGVSQEAQLIYRYIELSNRLKHTQLIAKQRKLEINYLLKEVKRLATLANSDVATRASSSDQQFSNILNFPSLFSLVPHLASNTITNLDPALRVAPKANQRTARFVFGIPTVKRDVESYLLATLQNLMDNLSALEKQHAVFVVMIAETNLTFVRKVADDLQAVFPSEIELGLLEIISPPAGLYFQINQLAKTLDDPIERVQWRSKQNLDFAYLMMYCQSKAIYYIQLEDDIISKPSYLYKMDKFITKKTLNNPDWVVLDFCALGFIGKLFKTIDLPKLIVFFGMFFNDKPVDWLLDNYVQTKVCRFDKSVKDCKLKKDRIWIAHKPSLFQHVGTHSSLKGKIQKLRDKGFGRVKFYKPHLDNPKAVVRSTFEHYQKHSFDVAYEGRDFFWAPWAKPGDELIVDFEKATLLESCLVRTGSFEHPEDIFYNASLLVKPNHDNGNYGRDEKGFVHLAHFDPNRGLLQANVPSDLNPIQSIRIVSQQNSTHWILISEIYFKTLPQDVT